ncbi:MAG: hypothetical protein WCP85_31175, partial [Mariniphaga sp.]
AFGNMTFKDADGKGVTLTLHQVEPANSTSINAGSLNLHRDQKPTKVIKRLMLHRIFFRSVRGMHWNGFAKPLPDVEKFHHHTMGRSSPWICLPE